MRDLDLPASIPGDGFGDGSRALEMAERLPDLQRGAAYFDSVAGVYARRGQKEKAIHHQHIAVDKCAADGWCGEDDWECAVPLRQSAGDLDWC